MGFFNIVGSYCVSPSLSHFDELSFPLRFLFIGLNTFMDLRALDICLGDQLAGFVTLGTYA